MQLLFHITIRQHLVVIIQLTLIPHFVKKQRQNMLKICTTIFQYEISLKILYIVY